ncbi:hypothetical protein C0Q70_09561 [Pomacea canaliculata]|uniref:G-protein coupled receptors family 1 profile domain-containing protein n=1 Tax=Pomacea canaliculata TaxID=400727 RepID=A0A2T7PA52_POMCA|nr:hypothetical protein C0Q70_09561 [Pomacea canaliculata]
MSVVEESTWMKAAADKARHSRLSRAIVCMSCTGRPVHSFRVVSQSFHRHPCNVPERQSSTRCRVGSHGQVGPDEVASLLKVNNWIQAILIKLIPCGMLTTLTILLIHAMHKAYRKRMLLKSQGRKAESDKHGEHNRTTGMLLAVVVLFTITELPQGILTLMNIFVDCFRDIVYNSLGDLLDAMALINNSVNFVLYCSMSRQFRETFVQVFCSFCSQHRPGWLKLKLITSTDQHGNGQTAIMDMSASSQNNTHTTPEADDSEEKSGRERDAGIQRSETV